MSSFAKLSRSGNSYFINSRKEFSALGLLSRVDILKCFSFAYEMSFGEGGEHRPHRSGGSHMRRKGELFINAFQGKLTEYAFFRCMEMNSIPCSEPDMETYDLGRWDSCDLEVCGFKLNLKSTKFYGSLLLLETKDWNARGQYLPNLSSGDVAEYDFFFLSRIKPDGERLMRSSRLLYCDEVDETELRARIIDEVWEHDVAGWISHEEFQETIADQCVLPRGSMLNGKVRMDAENYYVQSGEMHSLEDFLAEVKKER